jgi:hypothetical protein
MQKDWSRSEKNHRPKNWKKCAAKIVEHLSIAGFANSDAEQTAI